MKVHVIPVASDLGAPRGGTRHGPEVLRLAGLEARIGAKAAVRWSRSLRPLPVGSAAEALARLAGCTATTVRASLHRGELPLVLGGDHSVAIGTWSGVASARRGYGPIGLLWIDAHMDAHTSETSETGQLHGMPLAALLGYGEARLTAIAGAAPRLLPEFVCLVGVRSYELGEAALLARLGVRVFLMDEVRARGLANVLAEARAIVGAAPGGYGVSLDVDALDPQDAPGVTVPAADGLRAVELQAALANVAGDASLQALEVVEYDPLADRDGVTARTVVDLVGHFFPQAHAKFSPMPTEAPAMSCSIALETQYGARNYAPLPVVLVRGEGVHLWDESGRRYLDMMSAYSAVSLGHSHPELVRVLAEQASRLAITSRAFHTDRLPPLLEKLCALTGLARALPVNTGLEAVETALKAARKWAYRVKGVPADRAEIICCDGNFHGRSIAIVAMSSEEQYRDGFGPFPPGFRRVPFADADALERAIGPHTAAFLVEPIQGEGGIVVPPRGYLRQCAEICRRHRVLLIVDEVQTGLGRTGRMFAWEHDGAKPDGICLGKALGGGLLPVSAFVATDELMGVFTAGDHGSTFGGNPLGAAVAARALDLIVEGRLPQRAAQLGELFIDLLRRLRSPLVREVRGRGLLLGVELDTRIAPARAVAQRLLERGLLTKDTHGTVLRFAPPLVIDAAQIAEAVAMLEEVFDEFVRGVPAAA